MRRLLDRVRAELSADFRPDRPMRVSRAPGRLDVMGGIADYSGSLVCEMPMDRAVAVALQERDDRQVQVFSFSLFDEQQPFTLRMPLDSLANVSAEALRADFGGAGRKWAGYLIGCMFLLHERGLLDLRRGDLRGVNIAIDSSVPLGAGVASSAAIAVATMMALADHYGVRQAMDPLMLAEMCQSVENRIVGAPCGIMDQVTSCAGESGALLLLRCQPHDLRGTLKLPPGVGVIGINSNVRHSVGGGMYGKTRCAAFMGHGIILAKMRQEARPAGRPTPADPTGGYLANVDPDAYEMRYRPLLPASIRGADFLARFGPTVDKATAVDPGEEYHVRQATDHHVREARRVRRFVSAIQSAGADRSEMLREAGAMMFDSHRSYTHDALLGAEECDVLVELVRRHAAAGLWGAKITGGGSGGTVAALVEQTAAADAAIAQILGEYQRQTGRQPEAMVGSSPGAWAVGTMVV